MQIRFVLLYSGLQVSDGIVLNLHVTNCLKQNIEVPFIMTNIDVTFEGGLHSDRWPPFPWFAGLLFRWLFVPKNKNAWRFSTCDPKGNPRELLFV